MVRITQPPVISAMNLNQIDGTAITTSTFVTGQKSISTSATKIVDANTDRRTLIIMNHSGSTVFIGKDNTVTTSNGLAVTAGSALNLTRLLEGYKGAVYGIVASGTATISYLEA